VERHLSRSRLKDNPLYISRLSRFVRQEKELSSPVTGPNRNPKIAAPDPLSAKVAWAFDSLRGHN